jgi:hypothetical protein
MTKAMTKEWMDKKEFDVVTIVEDAISSLVLQGMKNESALSLLAIQSIIRMSDTTKLRGLIKLIEERLDEDDDDDDDDPKGREAA